MDQGTTKAQRAERLMEVMLDDGSLPDPRQSDVTESTGSRRRRARQARTDYTVSVEPLPMQFEEEVKELVSVATKSRAKRTRKMQQWGYGLSFVESNEAPQTE
jgi:hypothetical protein